MSARPEQADLEEAIRAADEAAAPGTALLVLGSALSWHQQLWAPLWTERPLFYDNWLWYWHPNHAGTPGYDFLAGHHYPDPERTLERDYLARHGIGAVVVTGPHARGRGRVATPATAAARRLRRLFRHRSGNDGHVRRAERGVTRVRQSADRGGERRTWRPGDRSRQLVPALGSDGRCEPSRDRTSAAMATSGIAPAAPVSRAELVYSVQPLDWARARALAGRCDRALAGSSSREAARFRGIGAGMLNRRERKVGSDVNGIGE